MLMIKINDFEYFNEKTNEFHTIKGMNLELEHSLVSLSKWESKWCKPFLFHDEKTEEEILDYIRCMTINRNVPQELYYNISEKDLKSISAYIDAPMTATTFSKDQKSSREIVTSEIIYYWMIINQIPFECQKWHLSRLLTLIKVCSIKNSPQKKMSRRDTLSRNAQLNAARRKNANSMG